MLAQRGVDNRCGLPKTLPTSILMVKAGTRDGNFPNKYTDWLKTIRCLGLAIKGEGLIALAVYFDISEGNYFIHSDIAAPLFCVAD